MGQTTQTFDILKRIAVGNGALVYRALNKVTMRDVALKLLVREGEMDHMFDVDALLADSARLRQITGTQVCQLLDAYTDEDGPVLVYEYADGVPGSELPARKKLSPVEALDVAAQLISALRSGERQKCPHGDIKPSNLVFVELADKRPFLLVLDWGLAAHRSALPGDSMPFVAPERLGGAPASHAADLFSAGAVLFYLFTGQFAANGNTAEEMIAAWRQARPAVLAQLRPDLPAKLVQWVCGLLEFEPARRPASAVEAGTALAALGPPPPPVPPESIRPRPAAAPASGISKPPPAPVSAVRAAPAPAAAAVSKVRPVVRPPAPKQQVVRKGRPLLAIALYAVLAAAVFGGGWFAFFRDKGTDAEEFYIPEKAPEPVAARPAPQSVGPPIGKPVQLPNVPPSPAAKPQAKTVAAKKPDRRKAPAAAPAGKPAPAARPAVKPSDSPVLVADSFEYAPGGKIHTLGGGAGWGGSWQGQPAEIDARPLVYPQFAPRGGCLFIPQTDVEVLLSRPLGPLEKFIDPAGGGTWHFAFLLQHGGETPVPGGDVQLNPFNAADVHDLVRIVATDAGGVLQLTLNNEKSSLEAQDPSKPALVVLRTTLANPKLGNWDVTAELFVNPQINAQWPPTDARKVTVKLAYVPVPRQLGLLIRKPPRTEAPTRIDEIRFARRAVDLFDRPAAPAAAKK
jgi:serine/threonine-protein kinase